MSSNNLSLALSSATTAKYLPECLNSLITQDYTQWEAIVVNDASTDNSYDVASRFANTQDNRIRLQQRENEGLHLARKSGTALSAGKYVLFFWTQMTPLQRELLTKFIRQFKKNYLTFCVLA